MPHAWDVYAKVADIIGLEVIGIFRRGGCRAGLLLDRRRSAGQMMRGIPTSRRLIVVVMGAAALVSYFRCPQDRS